MSDVFLKTERLILRPPAATDAAAITAGLSNFEVSRWLAVVPHPYGLADAKEWLGKVPSRPQFEQEVFLIDLPGSGVIGTVSIRPELGYWLAQPHWGNGYTTEAAQALLRWHFATFTTADIVRCSARIENATSRAVQRKLGFVETGLGEGYSRILDEPYVVARTELTRAAFKERFQ